jgi:hypothetical protein
MNKKLIDKIISCEFVSVLKGSYWITNPENTASARYRLPRGIGYMVVNLGEVELGDEENVKRQIRSALEKLFEKAEREA